MGKKRRIIAKPQKFGKKHVNHPLAKTVLKSEEKVEEVAVESKLEVKEPEPKPEPKAEVKKPEPKPEVKKSKIKKQATPAPARRTRRRTTNETN
tara:strand:- start:28 stop:309 length:282 start_codon:yes stop_codon:yes gene_type:complete